MSYDKSSLSNVLQFWFEELSVEDWFSGGEALDQRIAERFSEVHAKVAAGEYWQERTNPESLLAEIIVLDQFSRQLFRGEAKAFAYDGMALTLAQFAISQGYDKELSKDEKMFLYMPFMHSESVVIHETALDLFESLGDDEAFRYEKIHKDIIDRFGRYPHRNEQLNRVSTKEEKSYLDANQEDFFAS